MKILRFGYPSHPNFDWIHLRGKIGVEHYSGSMINALSVALDIEVSLRPKRINLPIPSETYLKHLEHKTYSNMITLTFTETHSRETK